MAESDFLVTLALGDAFGSAFEYVTPDVIRDHLLKLEYRSHPKFKRPPGTYTDDTQMALAVAELLLDKDPATWTMFDVARAFIGAFMRDPRTGYASNFYKLLHDIHLSITSANWPPNSEGRQLDVAAASFLGKVRPHSNKSGGAMRAAPLGLLPDKDQVRDFAMMQASLTHATRMGMEAAAAAALLTHYFYYRVGERAKVGQWLDNELPGWSWDLPWTRRVESEGYQHVRAAIRALTLAKTQREVLISAIAVGGDVDTVAAIAMPAATFCDDLEADLPANLFDELENGTYGRDYLRDVSRNLRLKFKRPKVVTPAVEPEQAALFSDDDAVRPPCNPPSPDYVPR